MKVFCVFSLKLPVCTAKIGVLWGFDALCFVGKNETPTRHTFAWVRMIVAIPHQNWSSSITCSLLICQKPPVHQIWYGILGPCCNHLWQFFGDWSRGVVSIGAQTFSLSHVPLTHKAGATVQPMMFPVPYVLQRSIDFAHCKYTRLIRFIRLYCKIAMLCYAVISCH